MIRNAVAVMLGKAGTMALGFLFWLLAAREFPPEAVGIAGGAVSAMMLCTQLAILGVGSAVITHYPRHAREPATLFDTAFTIVIAAGLAAAATFLVLAATVLHELHVVATSPLFASLFVAMTVLGTLQILYDQASIALRRGDHVFVRGLVFGVLTVTAVAAAPHLTTSTDPVVLFAPWVVAGAAVAVFGGFHLWRSLAGYRYRPVANRALTRGLFGVGLPNWALTLTERAPGLILPIIVTELLSPAQNATWYTVWMMAWVIYIVPISVGLALFAEASHQPETLRIAVLRGIRAALVIGVAGALLVIALAPFLLGLLGNRYAATGTTPLRILVVAVVPLTFVQAYFAACRARRRLNEAILAGVVSGVVAVVVAAASGALYGLSGMSIAWLIVMTLTGAWAIVRVRTLPNPGSDIDDGDSGVAERETATARSPRERALFELARARLARLMSARTPRLPVAGPTLVAVSLLGAAIGLWTYALPRIDAGRSTDYGLVSAFPATAFAALALVTVGFVFALLRARSVKFLLPAYLVVLIFMLYAVTAFAEPVAGFNVAYRHVGVVDVITRTGRVDPNIDAYFNWPGFFILLAFVTKAAGLGSAAPLIPWAPFFFNLMFLAPLYLIFRTATTDARLVWLSLWIFSITNWIGQDYLSPQAMTYFLYLAMLAIVLRWFVIRADVDAAFGAGSYAPNPLVRLPVVGRWLGPANGVLTEDGLVVASHPFQRVGLLAVTVLLLAGAVPSHQLTPFVMLASLVVLTASRRSFARGLPLIAVVLIGGWMSFMTVAFLAGHLDSLASRVGEIGGTLHSNVGGRVRGSTGHLDVVYLRLLFTAALWTLAGAGFVRALRRGRNELAYALLALAPFPLLALQPYGGEILLRVYLFSLPFTSFLAARTFFPARDAGRRRRSAVALTGVLLVFLTGFLFTRYGNERATAFTTAEVQGLHRLYEIAPRGALLMAGSENLPWKFEDYDLHSYDLVVDARSWAGLATGRSTLDDVERDVVQTMRHRGRHGAYLVLTRSASVEVDDLGLGPRGSLARFADTVAASRDFRLVYENRDVKIFTLARRSR